LERGEGRRTYGELDTIKNGLVSLNACAVAARAASARSGSCIFALTSLSMKLEEVDRRAAESQATMQCSANSEEFPFPAKK
jgi:hypothetical protein